MNWIKNLLLLFFVSLCTVKGTDLLFELAFSNKSDTLSSGIRSIILREHDPNQDIVVIPTDIYMTDTDGLVQKKYSLSTNANGFIKNANPEVLNESIVIAFLGGSAVEAIFVDEKDRFPSIVERKLREEVSPNLRTINAGVSGNNSFHSLLNFQAKVLPENPHIAILMNNINDLALLSKTGSYWVAPESKSLVQNSTNKSIFSQQVNLSTIARKIKNLIFPNLYSYLKPRLFPDLAVSDEFKDFRSVKIKAYSTETLSMFESSLKSFVALSNAWKIQPILMTQFNRMTIDDPLFLRWVTNLGFANEAQEIEDLYAALNQTIRRVAAETKTHLIDLDSKVPKSSDYIYDIVHLNTAGSKLVGDIISEEIVVILNN
jgi:hypothetical protein